MTRLLSRLAIALCLTLPVASFAQARDSMSEIAEQLELTPEQKTQVTELMLKSKSDRASIRARSTQAKLELRRLLGQPTLDEKALNTAVEAWGKAQTDLMKNRMGQMVSTRKVLTDAQWTELLAIWDDARSDRREDREED